MTIRDWQMTFPTSVFFPSLSFCHANCQDKPMPKQTCVNFARFLGWGFMAQRLKGRTRV